MATGYCSKGPKDCSCVGAFREGRDDGRCPHWMTPEKEQALSAVSAQVTVTCEDIDDLLIRRKLTPRMKEHLRLAQDVIEREKDKICRSR